MLVNHAAAGVTGLVALCIFIFHFTSKRILHMRWWRTRAIPVLLELSLACRIAWFIIQIPRQTEPTKYHLISFILSRLSTFWLTTAFFLCVHRWCKIWHAIQGTDYFKIPIYIVALVYYVSMACMVIYGIQLPEVLHATDLSLKMGPDVVVMSVCGVCLSGLFVVLTINLAHFASLISPYVRDLTWRLRILAMITLLLSVVRIVAVIVGTSQSMSVSPADSLPAFHMVVYPWLYFVLPDVLTAACLSGCLSETKGKGLLRGLGVMARSPHFGTTDTTDDDSDEDGWREDRTVSEYMPTLSSHSPTVGGAGPAKFSPVVRIMDNRQRSMSNLSLGGHTGSPAHSPPDSRSTRNFLRAARAISVMGASANSTGTSVGLHHHRLSTATGDSIGGGGERSGTGSRAYLHVLRDNDLSPPPSPVRPIMRL